jgi:signal peptidase I
MLILLCREYTLECGDIVVVQDESKSVKHPIIKRIIAMGGQTVRVTPTDIYVDGVKLDETYVYTEDHFDPDGLSTEYRYSVFPQDGIKDLVVNQVDGAYYEIVVPDGELFLLGDHRNNSKDSREIGTVKEDAVIGKALIRFYPIDKIAITE